MPVLTFTYGPLENNAYLVHNGKDAIIADPPDKTSLVLNALKQEGLTLRAILLTHLHFDHASGCAALSEAIGLPVQVGREDWEMKDTLLSRGMLFGLPEVPAFKAEILAPGRYAWGGIECEVIHAPGHSAGSLCYHIPREKALLAGDVLFYRSVGRSDFPGGDTDTLCRSLRERIYTLPPDTVVYPGHGPVTTVGEEAAHNPFCSV